MKAREEVQTRSIFDYLRFVPKVAGQPFEQYDLIHANYGLTAPAALIQRSLPVVVSLWGSDLLGRYQWLSKTCANRADAVIVMSNEMERKLGSSCKVIPHGVDMDLFQPIPQPMAQANVGWDPGQFHVFFPYPKTRDVKNYPLAERIVESVNDRLDKSIILQVAGGKIPHEEMPMYMNAADVMLLPSSHEGSPNTIKEAMACNLPIVSTDVGDVTERLNGVTNSFVCRKEQELADSVVEVFKSGNRSDGREHVRDVSLSRSADRIKSVYEGVVC